MEFVVLLHGQRISFNHGLAHKKQMEASSTVEHQNSKVWLRAYLSSIRQNTSCKILINGNGQWRHLAHNARHLTHAAQI
jgi:hypothetical protein